MELKFNPNIKGHEKAFKSLEEDISGGNTAHAYLFAGPAGIGKYSIAKKTAFTLQCPQGFCGNCTVCSEIDRGYHADTLEINDDGESLKIEPIREIIDKLNLTKTANHKILILENIERMTHQAANALLKTLEEPALGVIFLLTTANVKDVPPTIVSRVRLVNLDRLGDRIIEEMILERFPSAEEQVLKDAVICAGGRPGIAVLMMQDEALLEKTKRFFDEAGALLHKDDKTEKLLFVQEVAAEAAEKEDDAIVYDFLLAVERSARNEMIKAGKENLLQNAGKYVRLLQKTQEIRRLLRNNVNKRMLLENLMLSV